MRFWKFLNDFFKDFVITTPHCIAYVKHLSSVFVMLIHVFFYDIHFVKLIYVPALVGLHIKNENLAGVEKQKPKLKLDKPIFIGMSILDLSKQHM